ncbi:MAG: FliH/SctL family protein [Acidobacteriota bacterium]
MSSNRLGSRDRARSLEFQELSGQGSRFAGSGGNGRRSEADHLAAVERDAFQKGFEAGKGSGLEMAEKKIEAILDRFTEAIERLGHARDEVVHETRKDVLRLAVAIAQKLVQREINMDEEILLTLVQVALNKVNDTAPVTVYLNFEDHAYIRKALEERPQVFGERELVLKVKDDLKRGDCHFESPYGNIDARLSEQFQRIEQGLLSQF